MQISWNFTVYFTSFSRISPLSNGHKLDNLKYDVWRGFCQVLNTAVAVVIRNVPRSEVQKEKEDQTQKLNSMAPLSLPLNLKWTPSNVKATAPATTTGKVPEVPLPEKIRNSRILVLGGTGRVGGSTATALSNLCPDLQILVAGRNR